MATTATVCERCKHVNITNKSENTKRVKKPRMILLDDYQHSLLKAAASDFSTIGECVSFLLGLYEREKIKLNVHSSMKEVDINE
jgi:hypothetical protein